MNQAFLVPGCVLWLRRGELLMLGQNARQSIAAAGENDIAVNFIVRPAFFSGTLPFLGEEETPLRHFIISCLIGENEEGYLLFHVADILPIQNLIENLIYTVMENTPNKRGILQMTMGLLFAQLINHTDMLEFDTQEQNTLVSVLRYIEEQYQDGSLTEVAGQLHYEPSSLSRLIRKKTGKNYTELLQENVSARQPGCCATRTEPLMRSQIRSDTRTSAISTGCSPHISACRPADTESANKGNYSAPQTRDAVHPSLRGGQRRCAPCRAE
jgi:hypothetical protein